MKKSFIEALYYGEIRPFEHEAVHSPERDAAQAKIREEIAGLKGRLPPESAERLDDLDELYTRFALFEQEDCFAYGLRFGILLMMDILLADKEQPWPCRRPA